MKKTHLLLVLLIGLGFKTYPQKDTLLTDPVSCQEGTWKLVFEDEFNTGSLNTDAWLAWFPYTDDGGDGCVFCRTHGDEGQIFLDENVVVADSSLKIIAKRETATWMGEQRNYTSGMIHSRRAFGPGRYEVRAKLPAGMGFWPAIWTFGQIHTEIDIMEAGMQHPERYHTSVHNWKIGKMAHNRNKIRRDLSEGFHTYSMEWEPNIIRFFIDEQEVWALSRFTSRRGRNLKKCDLKPGRYRVNPVFPHENEKLFLIIGLGVGDAGTPFTKSPDEATVFPNKMEVDWIRFFERETE
jgi:beta-glucanase (GH16 family)